MDDIAKIAKGLTPSQRAAIWSPAGYLAALTYLSMSKRGLIRGMRLTPLGEDVRRYLQENPDAG